MKVFAAAKNVEKGLSKKKDEEYTNKGVEMRKSVMEGVASRDKHIIWEFLRE